LEKQAKVIREAISFISFPIYPAHDEYSCKETFSKGLQFSNYRHDRSYNWEYL